MVFCIVLGCGNRSERNSGAYCTVPAVRHHEGEVEIGRTPAIMA